MTVFTILTDQLKALHRGVLPSGLVAEWRVDYQYNICKKNSCQTVVMADRLAVCSYSWHSSKKAHAGN